MGDLRYMDQRTQQFWKDRAVSDFKVRMKWFDKYYETVMQEKPKQQRPAKYDELISKLEERRGVRYGKDSRGHRAQPKPPPPLPEVRETLASMRPVDPELTKLLYTGVSHERQGRYLYLRLRSDIPPETRFFFPTSENGVYGWTCGTPPPRVATYPRPSIIIHSFYRPHGIFPEVQRGHKPFTSMPPAPEIL